MNKALSFSELMTGNRRIHFNPAELSAFQELLWNGRPFSVFIYMLSLRYKMDGATGVCGLKERISYKELDEILERRPNWGSCHAVKKRSRGQIRHDLECLKRAGLIRPYLGVDKKAMPLVFFLPLADFGLIRLKKEQPEEQPEKIIKNIIKTMVCEDKKPEEQPEEQHTSINKTTNANFELLNGVLRLYHDAFPSAPKVKFCGPDVVNSFSALLVLNERFRELDFWEWYFFQVAPKNNFLTGREFKDRPFKLSFYGLINPKIIEGVLNGKIR